MEKKLFAVTVAVVMVMMLMVAGCGQKQIADTDVVAIPGDVGPGETVDADTLAAAMQQVDMPTTYEMTMLSPDGEELKQSVMTKDGEIVKIRIETEDSWVIVDTEQNAIFMQGGDEIIKMPMEAGNVDEDPTMALRFDRDVPITGSETIDGVDCWVAETTLPGDEEGTLTVWVGKQDGLMRKAEMDGESITLVYSNINAVDEALFTLPEGMNIIEMGVN